MALSKEIVYIGTFAVDAIKLKDTFGVTDLYKTPSVALNKYLSGGFGRKDGYEVVLLFGATGIGKSLVALNFIVSAIRDGVKVGLMILEDDMADASLRLNFILGEEDWSKMNASKNVRVIPKDSLVKSWSLDDLLALIEEWFISGTDLILLDHLQFAFEGAESIKGENEYATQRVFMQKLNALIKKTKKTIILVSHINKANNAKGMDRIVGSGAIAQAATKVIEITRDKATGDIVIDLKKSRFTRTPESDWHMLLVGTKLKDIT